MCYTNSVCYCRTHSQSGHSTQRKCLFSLTDLNAIWLSGANSVVLIQEKISPEDLEKGGSEDSFFTQPSSCTPCCSTAGLTTTVTNWTWCDWLCIEGSSLLPTKTHTSLDVTGSLGTHQGTPHDVTTQGNYGIYKKLYNLGRVSFNFLLFFSALGCLL